MGKVSVEDSTGRVLMFNNIQDVASLKQQIHESQGMEPKFQILRLNDHILGDNEKLEDECTLSIQYALEGGGGHCSCGDFEPTIHICCFTCHCVSRWKDIQICCCKVIRAEDLAAKDKTGKSDPYCVITVTTDEDIVFRTTTIKQNLNPRWDESFFFETDAHPEAELVVTLWDWDRFSSDDILGQVRIPLARMIETGSNTDKEIWYDVKPRLGKKDKGIKGKLLLEVMISKDEEAKNNEAFLKKAQSVAVVERKKKKTSAPSTTKHATASSNASDLALIKKISEENEKLKQENAQLKENIKKISETGDSIQHIKSENATLSIQNDRLRAEIIELQRTVRDAETQWKTEREELTAKLDTLRDAYRKTKKQVGKTGAPKETSPTPLNRATQSQAATPTTVTTTTATANTPAASTAREAPVVQSTSKPAEHSDDEDEENDGSVEAAMVPDVDPGLGERLKEAETAFKKYDLDGNGVIDFYEFKMIMESMRFAHFSPMNDGLFTMFVNMNWKNVDIDGDGSVSLEEFKKFLESPNSQTGVLCKSLKADLSKEGQRQRRRSRNIRVGREVKK